MSIQTISIPEVNAEQGFLPDEVELLSSGAQTAWDANAAQNAFINLIETTTILNMTGMKAGARYKLRAIQGSPARQLLWQDGYHKAADIPLIGTVNGGIYQYVFDSDGSINMLVDYLPDAGA